MAFNEHEQSFPAERFSGPAAPLLVTILYARVGLARVFDIPVLAVEALSAGQDSAALRALALLSPSSRGVDILEALEGVERELYPEVPREEAGYRSLLFEYWLLCLMGVRSPVGLTLALILYEGPQSTHTKRPPKDREQLFILLDDFYNDPVLDRRERAAEIASTVLQDRFPTLVPEPLPALMLPARSPIALFDAEGIVTLEAE